MVIPFKICRMFIWTVISILVTLTLTSLITGFIILTNDIDSGALYKFFQLVNLDFERNLPTWFSSALLTIIALNLSLVAYFSKVLKRPYISHWLFLSIIFFGLSMDEFIQGHEQIIRPTRETFNTDGLLYNAWIIPAGILVLVVGLLYLRFLFSLPRNTRRLFFVAGFIYVGATLGAEAIGGYYFSGTLQSLDTDYNVGYLLITNIEELLEMTGLTIFLYGLFQYIHELPLVHEAYHIPTKARVDKSSVPIPVFQHDRN